MNAPDSNSLERLKKQLYSRGQGPAAPPRAPLSGEAPPLRGDWGRGGPATALRPLLGARPARPPYVKLLFLASAIFFLVSISVAAFVFLGGKNIVSSSHVVLAVEGPASVDGGQELPLEITIRNDNRAALLLADLLIHYPDGTRSAEDINVALPRYRESVGTVEAGQEIKRTVRAVLFGESNTEHRITLELEYRVEGSNAIFVKQSTYDVTIGSSPISITVDSVSEITSGQETTLSITVGSNATAPIEAAMLRIEYPFGFTFLSSVPSPSYGNTTWTLGTLKARDKQTIKIRGKLEGQDNEERIFRFTAGVASPADVRTLGTAFLTTSESVTLKRPFIGIDLAINGESGKTTTARGGELLRGDITWTNNLPTQVRELAIEAKLTGSALDKRSVTVSRGFYRSADSTIIWDKTSDPGLFAVAEGASGVVSFTFSPLSTGEGGSSLRNPKMTLEVSVKGERLGEDNVPEVVSSFVSKEITIASDLVFSGKALHSTGPFVNSGPLPPRVEQQTTYTVLWSLANSSNALGNVKVTATLPPYMEWTGRVGPSSERLSYSIVGGTITWDVGDLKAGVGFGTPAREAAFQVVLVPSTSQINQVPNLIGPASVEGDDRFTGTKVSNGIPPLTTQLDGDPSFKNGQEFVAQ